MFLYMFVFVDYIFTFAYIIKTITSAMKLVRQLLSITLLCLFAMVPVSVNAQAKDGEYTVTQGNTVTVSISPAFAATLIRASSVSASWTAGSSAISIQSRTNSTCTIRGVSVTSSPVRLNFYCSYIYDGFYRTMNFYYDITVKSNIVYVTNVNMSLSAATMEVGETLQLSATSYPLNATNRSLNWTTENYSVASVSAGGVVTARGAGKVKIWARATDGSGAGDYCVVTVNEPVKVTSIELSETEKIMDIGEEVTLTARILPDDVNNKSVTWTSSNTSVATVAGGVVRAVSPGSCDIVCTSSDGSNISATCSITVNEPAQYWLSVVLPNGMFSINATDIEPVEIKITPDVNYEIHTITLNGLQLAVMRNETEITLSKIEENSILNVVFRMIDGTNAIDVIQGEESNITLYLSGNRVTVNGLQAGSTIDVYNLDGSHVMSTQENSFVLNSGVYIVRAGLKTYKFAI